MPRRGKLTIETPRWVAAEADLTVHLAAEDVCLARARAIGAGARRVAAARAELAKGRDAFAKARSRRLPAADRLRHLLRAERAFIEGHSLAAAPLCTEVVVAAAPQVRLSLGKHR